MIKEQAFTATERKCRLWGEKVRIHNNPISMIQQLALKELL